MLREGNNHSVYVNRSSKRATAVPRHRDVNDFLARKARSATTFKSSALKPVHRARRLVSTPNVRIPAVIGREKIQKNEALMRSLRAQQRNEGVSERPSPTQAIVATNELLVPDRVSFS